MFDSVPEYFSGILLKQNSIKFQKIKTVANAPVPVDNGRYEY